MEKRKIKLLIVDDSVLIQNMLTSSILKINNSAADNNTKGNSFSAKPLIKVAHAYNCEEAKRLFKCFKPDTVILDIALPDGSGVDLIPEFRESAQQMDIIMLTNYTDKDIIKKCFKNGANEFFDKKDLFKLLHCLETRIIH